MKDKNGFTWKYCAICDAPAVICDKCGNSCCNAGTGVLESGEECGCKEAYEYQHLAYKNRLEPLKSDFPEEDIMDNESKMLEKIFG